MKLYHGTSLDAAQAAWAQGLMPRARTKLARGNWSKHPSNRQAVYLTDCYPLYFALNAAPDGATTGAVLEVDTDRLPSPGLLVPDEDVLAQANKLEANGLPPEWDLGKRTAHYRKRLKLYQGGKQWQASLKMMGTCAYLGAIPPAAITRMVWVDFDQQPHLAHHSMQPSITLTNYGLCAHGYKAALAWLFEDPLPALTPDDWRGTLGANDTSWLSRLTRDGITLTRRS